MAVKKRIDRPDNVIKSNITPISNDVKIKCAAAVNEVVAKIKAKHLG